MEDLGKLTCNGKGGVGTVLGQGQQEEFQIELDQQATFLATLVLRVGSACGFEELRKTCQLFQVTSTEIESLCTLPNSPLCLVEDGLVGVTHTFLHGLRSSLEVFRIVKAGTVSPCDPHAALPTFVATSSLLRSPSGGAAVQGTTGKDNVIEGLESKQGGYGTVYRVKRKLDGQLFAIKCPLEKTTLDYVNHEIDMLQKIGGKEYVTRCEGVIQEDHNVQMEVGAETENQRPNLVLQYIEHDKPEILRKEITVQELQWYGYCLFKALAYLHKQGIMHRDVKPGNFLFSRKRRTGYLVDFNLALLNQAFLPIAVKARKLGSKSAKGVANREPGSVSANQMLGKRARKDENAVTISKRQQTLKDPCLPTPSITDVGGPRHSNHRPSMGVSASREALPAGGSHYASVSSQQTLQPTTSWKPRIKGGIAPTIEEGSRKRSIAADSSSKATVVTDACAPSSGLCGNRHSFKPATPSREQDGGPVSQSVLGELAWMPPTLGVLRYAQFLKQRTEALNRATTTPTPPSNPPASQRKRVAALQHKNRGATRLPVSPPKPHSKGMRRNLPKDGPCAGTKGYRAPEVLLKSNMQSTKLDIWSAGVSLLQLVAGRAPFPSSTSEQALRDIAKLRGAKYLVKLAKEHNCFHKLPLGFQALCQMPVTVKEWCSSHARRIEMIERLPASLFDLLEKCLQVDPNIRIDAAEALCHEFFEPCQVVADWDEGGYRSNHWYCLGSKATSGIFHDEKSNSGIHEQQ